MGIKYQNQNNKYLLFLLRHGERADNSQDLNELKKIINKQDPPLTELGKIQAFEAGQEIKNYLIQNKNKYPHIKNLIIISSPFLRCLMTAENIHLGLENYLKTDEIITDNYLCEHLQSQWFNKDILQNGLCIRNQTIKNKNNNLQNFINLKINDSYNDKQFLPKYPENNYEQLYERATKGFDTLQKKILIQLQNNKSNKNHTYRRNNLNQNSVQINLENQLHNIDTAVIIVSHGNTLRAILENVKNSCTKINYTNLTGFEVSLNEKENNDSNYKNENEENNYNKNEKKERYTNIQNIDSNYNNQNQNLNQNHILNYEHQQKINTDPLIKNSETKFQNKIKNIFKVLINQTENHLEKAVKKYNSLI
ncbi:hypothetical protein PPERSA_02415 [Pseudocohnilembus persalinus]|uniref:Histidine phosphatase superfamily, clade-1 n=1 Tax=Pseudocohnilembus persalinus TaxID=266149 RepID=A0A0V0QB52_PSEPJ|nr:hypothetical protein PPERSA_02415 [Pseudocohnilembus persalinus]|eukprot:KRW99303.1 hypothetical protein PPERSA_02415 [Pseudocohnilembus persalinus]